MATVAELSLLLGRLESLADDVSRRLELNYGAAMSSFPLRINTVDEFERAVGEFVMRVTLGSATAGMSPENLSIGARIHAGHLRAHIEREWGASMTAYRIYGQGLEGGRRAFLNRLFGLCIAWQVAQRADSLVEAFWRGISLDVEQMASLTDAYFAGCGNFLPADVRNRDRYARTTLLRQLLDRHTGFVATMRAAASRFS